MHWGAYVHIYIKDYRLLLICRYTHTRVCVCAHVFVRVHRCMTCAHTHKNMRGRELLNRMFFPNHYISILVELGAALEKALRHSYSGSLTVATGTSGKGKRGLA